MQQVAARGSRAHADPPLTRGTECGTGREGDALGAQELLGPCPDVAAGRVAQINPQVESAVGHPVGDAALVEQRDRRIQILAVVGTGESDVALVAGERCHARALIGAPDPEALADQVVTKGLSVRQTEKLAQSAKPATTRKPGNRASAGGSSASGDAVVAALERQLGDLLGVRVRITYSPNGGSLTIDYSTLDQLDMICQRLSGEPI